MPLYDCMLLAKPTVNKQAIQNLVSRLGERVFKCKGVITDIKSFGTVQLGYGIKKLDGRHYQGHLMQITMMVPPSFPGRLQYLNKEDRLLRWLIVKHRNTVYGLEAVKEDDGNDELSMFSTGSLYRKEREDDTDDDDDDDEGDDDIEKQEQY
ncbi:hypothetical protein KSP40_PGU008666 [Platanthera guangdongensis]|uniref:Ribosomal protein S6 n=1 Tax=Platanthera guangdongensis TaxID=2320717 RepID=A0ABR2LEC7_9ASPA